MSQKIKLIAFYFQTIPNCKTPSTWGEAVKVTEFTGLEIGDFMEGDEKPANQNSRIILLVLFARCCLAIALL